MSEYTLIELLGLVVFNADEEGMITIPANVIHDTIVALMQRDQLQARIDELEKARTGAIVRDRTGAPLQDEKAFEVLVARLVADRDRFMPSDPVIREWLKMATDPSGLFSQAVDDAKNMQTGAGEMLASETKLPDADVTGWKA